MTGRVYKFVSTLWPLLLLAGFASVLLPQPTVVGYRWSVELVFAGFLLVTSALAVFAKDPQLKSKISRSEFIWVILPILIFTLWSGLSIFWAVSWRGALHHTLLWCCYAIFYLLIRRISQSKDLLLNCLNIVGAVVFIIGSACVIEFTFAEKPLTSAFITRYYVSGEIIVSLLPLVIAVAIKDIKRWIQRIVTILVAWCAVVVTVSRSMFLAGLSSFLVIGVLTPLAGPKPQKLKRWILLSGSIVVITFASQFALNRSQNPTLVDRFSGSNDLSVRSAESRLKLWGMAIEGFRQNPIVGLGGDNYFSNYKVIRQAYFSRERKHSGMEIDEDLIPERAHNEYLQILSELGLVGGLIFAWLLVGIAFMFFRAIRNGASLMTIGALSGIVAFLVASLTSSYSFRFPANGICFFFLLAVAAKELLNGDSSWELPNLRRWFFALGIVTAISMMIFSAIRGTSIWHLANSQNTSDKGIAESEIRKAIGIDPSEPMFRFYYGQQLYIAARYDEAIPEMRLAIDNGVANSTSYFNLLAAQMLSGKNDDAFRTFEEALRVYPRSIFLRTAFASFLKRQGDMVRADTEFQKASAVDPKQAQSWQLAHDDGLERLVQRARVDDNFVTTMYLTPESAPLALVNFQRQLTGPQPSRLP
jgi:O-antigen ligase